MCSVHPSYSPNKAHSRLPPSVPYSTCVGPSLTYLWRTVYGKGRCNQPIGTGCRCPPRVDCRSSMDQPCGQAVGLCAGRGWAASGGYPVVVPPRQDKLRYDGRRDKLSRIPPNHNNRPTCTHREVDVWFAPHTGNCHHTPTPSHRQRSAPTNPFVSILSIPTKPGTCSSP